MRVPFRRPPRHWGIALSFVALACHRAPVVPAGLGLTYRPQRLDSPFGHCDLPTSAERARTLALLLKKRLWPVEGGLLFESDGPGGYSVMLSAISEHEVKVYDFESEQWLTEPNPGLLLPFHEDGLRQELIDGADPTAIHLSCEFLSMVIDHHVATALDIDNSRLWRSGEHGPVSTNTLLGALIKNLLDLDNGVAAYERQLDLQRWKRAHPHGL